MNPEGFEDLFTHKLDRIEDLNWESPFFTFRIERHGGTTLGSTRAEMQYWKIDLDNLELFCQEDGYRQLSSKQPGVNVNPVEEELVPFIVNRSPHKWLKWSAMGRVRVLTGKIFPDDSAFKETVRGRRRRLIKALEKRLNTLGWKRKGFWWDCRG